MSATHTKMKWQRPAVDSRALGLKPCEQCGAPCALEYAVTDQREPNEFTLWTPMCGACKQHHEEVHHG